MAYPFDPHPNGAYSLVATAPSPASSGTSLVVTSGDGSKFSSGANAVLRVKGNVLPIEIVRVGTISGDTLPITRAQESTSALSVDTTYEIYQGPTAKTLTDLEGWLGNRAAIAWFCEDFLYANALHDLAFTSSGSGTSFGTISSHGGTDTNHPGIVYMRSGSVVGAYIYIAPGPNGYDPAALWTFEVVFKTPAILGNADAFLGMGQGNSLATNGMAHPALAQYLAADGATPNLKINVAGTLTDTLVTLAATTWYKLRLRWDGTNIKYSVNDAAEANASGTYNASLGTAVAPAVQHWSQSTTFEDLWLDYILTYVNISR